MSDSTAGGLHPAFAPFAARLVNRDGLAVADLPRERAAIAAAPGAPDPKLIHTPHVVASADGHEVRVLVARRPELSEPAPALLWIHGGGYMLGTPEMDQQRIDHWAAEHGCVVVSPDYRLAPEHPYPAAHDDCAATLAWVVDAAQELGVDPQRVLVGGISAGGGLAAGLVLRTRDEATLRLRGQVLICPMLDDRFLTYPSGSLAVPSWTGRANTLGWQSYLGLEGPRDYAVAGRAESVAGLPPTFVGIAGLDILRDEALIYARRLLDAAVPTDVHLYQGAPHGFIAVAPSAPQSVNVLDALDGFLRTSFTD